MGNYEIVLWCKIINVIEYVHVITPFNDSKAKKLVKKHSSMINIWLDFQGKSLILRN